MSVKRQSIGAQPRKWRMKSGVRERGHQRQSWQINQKQLIRDIDAGFEYFLGGFARRGGAHS